jgi:cellulose synthase/poly-beta-1,6-N-acetylglucosamine synthase-like glycosyltransferase
MAYRDDTHPGPAGAGRRLAAGAPPRPRPSNIIDFPAREQAGGPELECLRGRLPGLVLARAQTRAATLGTGADRVLIAEGAIGEHDYVTALCGWLGLEFEPLDDLPRAACPLSGERLLDAATAGLLPLIDDGRPIWVIAPRNLTAGTLCRFVARHPEQATRLRLTSNARLERFVAVHGYAAQGTRAAHALADARPDLSARPRPWRLTMPLATLAAATPAALIACPEATVMALEASLATGFVAWLSLRLIGSFVPLPPPRTVHVSDAALPVYTVIVALYREAQAVEDLIEALRALDYPPEKLDIKLVIEPDDEETWAALARMKLRTPFEIVIAPDIGPRTKPKALNSALPFARGSFTAVYDAEDRPEPDQLRRVLAAFMSAPDDLACVQARLTIDNTADNWLTRIYTAEYAAQFDLFLPGLAALRLPLPLGGSSNHFRTDVLRRLHGWDAYNVTEDADLGMRLARLGYRTTVVASTTFEEAPARIGPWLRQRTRWFKGWLKTWMVHMRAPLRLLRELGAPGFLAFQLVVGGSVLAALIHPVFLAHVLYVALSGSPFLVTDGMLANTLVLLYASSLGAGYAVSIALGVRGLARRGLLSSAWALALIPLHWLLLSLAAWRALYQLVRDPCRWEKTEHGLAATSRRARATSHSVLQAALRPEQPVPHREAAE